MVDRVIENDESQIKEYVIATEVFGRGSEFDSRIDSVVRVQAGRLRTKLQEYYATEGKGDLLLIVLPKGQYTPVFSPAQKPDAPEAEVDPVAVETTPVGLAAGSLAAGTALASTKVAKLAPIAEILDPEASDSGSAPSDPVLVKVLRGADPRGTPPRGWQVAAIAFAILAIVSGALALFYRAKVARLPELASVVTAGGMETINRTELEPLWGDMLRSPEPVLVVFSNTLFRGNPEAGMKLLKSLDAPGSSLGSPIIPQSEIEESREPVIEHYTGIGEVMGAYFLGDFFVRMHHPSRVKRSLLLNWEDLKTENIVVLGSPAENLFLRDLPQKQDFIFKPHLPNPDDNGKRAFGIVNTRPQPGEQPYYFATQGGPSRSQISEDYAVVGLLEGLNAKNRLLILAGITTLGTQAAAEYVVKPDYIRDLIKHLNLAPSGETPKLPANYQVLVKVKVNGGVPVQVTYVTHHVLNQ
ncbi:MAG TPA: hypothetical protein VJ302_34665 [Blastocatellia bacterium]|nr:hypothetical protein [Blastocatellia bacterium]